MGTNPTFNIKTLRCFINVHLYSEMSDLYNLALAFLTGFQWHPVLLQPCPPLLLIL